MEFLGRMLEPQNLSLNAEIWFLIALIVTFTTYFARIASDMPTGLIAALLATGAYFGNVAARALEWVAVSSNVSADIVLDSTYATFAGMLALMFMWFVVHIAMPHVIEPKKLVRPNEPKGVVGRGA